MPATRKQRAMWARASVALVIANLRYWSSVRRIVRSELGRWELRARAVEDPQLRKLALEKLKQEGSHAEAAAMLATLAARPHRREVIEAIVALELLFDYLDGVSERPLEDPLRDGARLFQSYLDAVSMDRALTQQRRRAGEIDDAYAQELSEGVRGAVERLPGAAAVAGAARACAERSAQAQIRMHAVPRLGAAQLETWASSEATGTGLQWREFAAGAGSSVLAIHALIAAAGDRRTTPADATKIAESYLSTCVLLTLLDGIVDHEQDLARGTLSYASFYPDPEELADTLSGTAAGAVTLASRLRHGPHHVMTLVGVAAYYTSAPGARRTQARRAVLALQGELRPLISPTLGVMAIWRRAQGLRGCRLRGGSSVELGD
jgi:tetraprenyl-beta-curcumene synthase